MSTQGPDPLRDLAAEPELTHLLQLLGAAPTERELAGQNDAIRAFRTTRNAPTPARRGRTRAVFASLVSAKFGATIAGVAIGLTGVATAAVLPTAMSAGPAGSTATPAPAPPAAAAAPIPTMTAAPPSAAPVGPDASGPAVKGLCTAWRTQAARTGKKPATWQDAAPFSNLVAAAGGPAEVEAFCAEVAGQAPASPRPTGLRRSRASPLSDRRRRPERSPRASQPRFRSARAPGHPRPPSGRRPPRHRRPPSQRRPDPRSSRPPAPERAPPDTARVPLRWHSGIRAA
jgi:hypothetical protein